MDKKKVLEQFAQGYVNLLKSRINSDTGNLANSIGYNVVINTNAFQVNFTGEDYLFYQEYGVNGTERNRGSRFSFTKKKPPLDAIKGWAGRKGLNPFAVQNSIFKKGIPATHTIENTLYDYIDSIMNDFTESLWEEFERNLLKIK